MRPATNGSQVPIRETAHPQEWQGAPITKEREDEKSVRYEIRLILSGLAAERDEDLRQLVEAFVETQIPQARVDTLTVNVKHPPHGAIDERIVALDELYIALPTELRLPEIRASLCEHYHRELACMWRSVRDTRCVEGVVELRTWRQARNQMICEFLSFDNAAPRGHRYNMHGQDTSQWRNAETGWAGHQGAIVLDTQSGEISAHH